MIKILDTTLRDGEQTSSVSFSPDEKLIIAENLLSVIGAHRLEVGSCKVSLKEKDAVIRISKWAQENGFIDRIEVLAFTDYDKSINWLLETECRTINLLTKGSRKHCEVQLKKTAKEHASDILKTLEYAEKHGVSYNVYLEDWSRGADADFSYTQEIMDALKKANVKNVILCDTMGILNPWKTFEMVSKMKQEYPDLSFDFHCHNDYGLAVANSLYAVKAGVSCIHATVNGLGERAGNTNLMEFAVAARDHLNIDLQIGEQEFFNISSIVQRFSGKRTAANAPIVGRDAFTQTAGVHADGDAKGDLYKSRLNPARFGRETEYSLGKLSGMANLEIHLRNTGILLENEQKREVLTRIVEMSDAKKTITADDLPFIIADVTQKQIHEDFKVLECIITSSTHLLPMANVKIAFRGKEYCKSSTGNGGYDAFMNALQIIAKECAMVIPQLVDFEVSIPKGGHTNALVETVIIWQDGVKTTGISADQIMASIKATQKAVNLFNG